MVSFYIRFLDIHVNHSYEFTSNTGTNYFVNLMYNWLYHTFAYANFDLIILF